MKKFILGFICGAVLFVAIGVIATTFTAEVVQFPVFVNGDEFTSDPMPVLIEGRTFLPLRAMGDALGVEVYWNEELRQVEVGERVENNIIEEIISRHIPSADIINTEYIMIDTGIYYLSLRYVFDYIEEKGFLLFFDMEAMSSSGVFDLSSACLMPSSMDRYAVAITR